ncbi:hypothetical protein HDU98_003081 [Podochytrium sp. JEL0797]|nr:hypothetical protein HDU98_003081 [Podochytrium sp. JEL0797]
MSFNDPRSSGNHADGVNPLTVPAPKREGRKPFSFMGNPAVVEAPPLALAPFDYNWFDHYPIASNTIPVIVQEMSPNQLVCANHALGTILNAMPFKATESNPPMAMHTEAMEALSLPAQVLEFQQQPWNSHSRFSSGSLDLSPSRDSAAIVGAVHISNIDTLSPPPRQSRVLMRSVQSVTSGGAISTAVSHLELDQIVYDSFVCASPPAADPFFAADVAFAASLEEHEHVMGVLGFRNEEGPVSVKRDDEGVGPSVSMSAMDMKNHFGLFSPDLDGEFDATPNYGLDESTETDGDFPQWPQRNESGTSSVAALTLGSSCLDSLELTPPRERTASGESDLQLSAFKLHSEFLLPNQVVSQAEQQPFPMATHHPLTPPPCPPPVVADSPHLKTTDTDNDGPSELNLAFETPVPVSLRTRQANKTGRGFMCSCGVGPFMSYTSLRVHVQTHGAELKESFKCDMCSAVFLRKNDLKRHKNSNHEIDHTKQKQKEPAVCGDCGLVFSRKDALHRHVKRRICG